jgi:hypothetical protein
MPDNSVLETCIYLGSRQEDGISIPFADEPLLEVTHVW